MGETFKLNFVTNGEGIVDIDELVGFDGIDFKLKQKEKGYGRDISFAGGKVKFTFYRMRNHYFETIMYYFETFGWESEVKLIIEKEGIDNIIGDLDFKEADTDQLEYFSCNVIQDTNRAILERRAEINVDMFSSENVDGDTINPLTTENVLVKAKPITQISNWVVSTYWAFTGNISGFRILYQNPLNVVEDYEIQNTVSFFDRYIITSAGFPPTNSELKNFAIIDAQDNLSNITITVENLLISYFVGTGEDFNDNSTYTGVDVTPGLTLYVGTDDNVQSIYREGINLAYTKEFIGSESIERFGDFTGVADRWDLTFDDVTINIDSIPRGYKLYAVFYMDRYNTIVEWLEGEMTSVATSIAYNTIAPSIRLYDVVSQVVLSTSGLATSFPFTEINGEMYDQRLFNGNLLRNITDRPFNVSLKDISEWIVEINGDYEVQNDNTVFFGKYADFYTNNEIGVFTDVRFDDYKKSFNKKYAINQLIYEYKKYQSQKENEVKNTFDVVHGSSQWSILNRFVENKKEVSVGFVRDAFYIEEQRKKAILESNSTSTQDDDTIFIIDTLEAITESIFEETDFLQHTFDENIGILKITNTGDFSFILLGIVVGDIFEILGGDTNAGTYTVESVGSSSITLSGTNASTNGDGERVTSFRYIISLETARYITWTNEGFTYIDNINNPNNYANLKYTIKRNIRRFYSQYLATANTYTNSAIKNTEYKNNGDLSLGYEGMQTVESDPYTPTDPILSPYTHQITLVTDFNTYKALENSIKTDRGYIRTFDAKGLVIKIYPQEMTYVNSAEIGELKIFGEEKNQPSLINIIYGNTGYLTINDEYRTTNIIYENVGEIFYIFDALGRLLYDPVFWQKITVNDAVPTTKEELIQWLSLLS
jgi:hypothetical protein